MSIHRTIARRWRIAVAAGLLFPSAAFAQVGYINYHIDAGRLDLVSVPFIVPGGNHVTNAIPGLGSFLRIYLWDPDLNVWDSYPQSGKGWSYPARDILPGEAFFLGAVSVEQDITISGSVPPSPQTNVVSGDISYLAYPYPMDVLWTNTALADLLPEGSIVSFWNMASSGWSPAFLKAPAAKGGGWGATANTYVISAGDGFLIEQPPGSSSFDWVEP